MKILNLSKQAAVLAAWSLTHCGGDGGGGPKNQLIIKKGAQTPTPTPTATAAPTPTPIPAPVVSSIVRGSSANPAAANTDVDFVVNFSEAVTGVSQENFSVTYTGNTFGTATVASVTCVTGTSSCTVVVTPQNPGNVRLDLSNVAGIKNDAGVALASAYSTGPSYTVGGWFPEAYVKPPNPEANDSFGEKMSLAGDLLAAGSPQEDSSQQTITPTVGAVNNAASDSGAVYLYRRTGSQWALEAYVKAGNAGSNDQFDPSSLIYGTTVALSGETLAVGAPFEDSNLKVITPGSAAGNESASNSGAVYVFRRTNSVWSQEAFIKAQYAVAGQEFGSAVALSGNLLAVSAPKDKYTQTTILNAGDGVSQNPASDTQYHQGAVYLYRRNGNTWSEEAYLKPPVIQSKTDLTTGTTVESLSFGDSLAVQGDLLAVGVPMDNSNQSTITTTTSAWNSANYLNDSGAVFILRRNTIEASGDSTKGKWAQEAYVKAANVGQGDGFGNSVSISGNTLAVGALYEDSDLNTITNASTITGSNEIGSNLGAVYIYERGASAWSQQAFIKAANAFDNSEFGYSMALVGDTLAVGARRENSNQTTIINGTTASFNASALAAGAVYVYRRTGTNWAQEAYVKAPNAKAIQYFGTSVALAGDTLAVGAPGEASNQNTITNGVAASSNTGVTNAGAVYVFRNIGRLFDPLVRVSARSATSITLSWNANLGNTRRVKVAPVATALNNPPACTDPDSVALATDVVTYTYTGLTANTKYGFRVCAFDGTNTSPGTIIRENTLATGTEQ